MKGDAIMISTKNRNIKCTLNEYKFVVVKKRNIITDDKKAICDVCITYCFNYKHQFYNIEPRCYCSILLPSMLEVILNVNLNEFCKGVRLIAGPIHFPSH